MELNKLQVGDLIACEMTEGFKTLIHRGVYVGETVGIGKHTVIHNFCVTYTRSVGEVLHFDGIVESNWIDDAKMMFNLKTGGGIITILVMVQITKNGGLIIWKIYLENLNLVVMKWLRGRGKS
ncbi:hypothetical protein ACQ4LE_010781 [Meloidogyne hapla]